MTSSIDPLKYLSPVKLSEPILHELSDNCTECFIEFVELNNPEVLDAYNIAFSDPIDKAIKDHWLTGIFNLLAKFQVDAELLFQ